MKYAINIGDLTTEPILGLIFGDVIDKGSIIHAEKTIDGMATALQCPEDRAKAIVETIRLKKKEKNLFRIYESKTGKSWKRI